MGREPLEIVRLSAGLWYTERRDLITALYTLLRVLLSSFHAFLWTVALLLDFPN